MNTVGKFAVQDLMKDELQRILSSRAITPHFQPIVDLLGGAVLGYEGLSRGPSDSFLHSPVALFEAAEAGGLLLDMERCAVQAIVGAFARMDLPGQLFLNVSPGTVAQSQSFQTYISNLLTSVGLEATRVVIELTETSAAADVEVLLEAISQLRRMAFVVALDDLGEGFASLKRWTEMRPDFVKIDRHFVDGLSQDPLRQQFIRSIMDMARSASCTVVAEGVETEADLLVLRQLGVHYVQGYVIARPAAAPRKSVRPELARLLRSTATFRMDRLSKGSSLGAHDLARKASTIHPETSCADVIQMFRDDRRLYSIVVLDENGVPLGMLRSLHCLARASELYFMELFGKRSCAVLMDAAPLIFDENSTLQLMSEAVANMDERYLIDGFIVTQEGKYWGTGRISDLLRAVSDRQLSAARYANPLTQLPGNVPLDEHVDGLLLQQIDFVIAHWDIGSFKAFNDVYGYRAGDDMIVFTADVLNRFANPDCDLLVHVGGDDFVTVFTSEDWQSRIEQTLAAFDNEVRRFYSPEHLQAGGYVTQNRQGMDVFQPLATLAAGVVPVPEGSYESHRDVAQAAAQTKSIAKKNAASSYFVERRGH